MLLGVLRGDGQRRFGPRRERAQRRAARHGITLDGPALKVESYELHRIDDTIEGDRATADEIDALKKTVTSVVFASRGYSIDQPLAVAPRDLPNTFTDIAAGTPLANLMTDAFRNATKADIGFTANGMMRASLTRGKSGVQTVYDLFAVAPLGAAVVDPTAGSALVTGYFTGRPTRTASPPSPRNLVRSASRPSRRR